MIPIVISPGLLSDITGGAGGTGDGMADSYISVVRYVGLSATLGFGYVSIGKNDIDTVEYFINSVDMVEGDVLSVHGDDDTDYKNTSGFDAIAVLVF